MSHFFRVNNVNNQPKPSTPSGPLDYRKLPNPTKGFGDKAQRRITTLMTPKYETQTGSPLPRAESEYVVCFVVIKLTKIFLTTRLTMHGIARLNLFALRCTMSLFRMN